MSKHAQAVHTYAMALRQTAVTVITERDTAAKKLNELLVSGSSEPQDANAVSHAATRRRRRTSLPLHLADLRLQNAITDCRVTLERIQHTIMCYPETASILDSALAGVTVGSIPPEHDVVATSTTANAGHDKECS